MATTTNYGWTTPDDTALVKDGASAIRTLGSSVDTTTKNLNPETTLGDISYRSSTANVKTRLPLGTAGQVLKVNSGATAPEWSSDNAGMTNPMTTTGDTIYSSSGSTPARLAIGSTGNVLTVAGGVPTWAAPASGGKLLQVVQATYSTATTNTTTTYADTGLTASITPSSASSRILVQVSQPLFASASGALGVGATLKIMRGATNIVADVPNGNYASGADREAQQIFSYSYVDSPATTSSTTYKTQFKKGQGDSAQVNGQIATIILMEIGA